VFGDCKHALHSQHKAAVSVTPFRHQHAVDVSSDYKHAVCTETHSFNIKISEFSN